MTEESPTLMPLTALAFAPGAALASATALPGGVVRDIALAEYHYYRGEAEAAANLAEPYLGAENPSVRLSASWLCGYANLSLNRISRTRHALAGVRETLAETLGGPASPRVKAECVLVARGATTLLHLPAPEGLPPLGQVMPALPEGLRLLAAYVGAHRRYLEGDRAGCVGAAEGALAFSEAVHPIPMIYLHLVCVMGLMSEHRAPEAQSHFEAAWELARPDGLIEPFAEHHGLLGGMVERCLKRDFPDDFRRIIDVTYRFSYGWRRVHNPSTHHEVADNLSTTQFTVAMLASRGWTNVEISQHLGVSANTVKSSLTEVYERLGISRRSELVPFMLG